MTLNCGFVLKSNSPAIANSLFPPLILRGGQLLPFSIRVRQQFPSLNIREGTRPND